MFIQSNLSFVFPSVYFHWLRRFSLRSKLQKIMLLSWKVQPVILIGHKDNLVFGPVIGSIPVRVETKPNHDLIIVVATGYMPLIG